MRYIRMILVLLGIAVTSCSDPPSEPQKSKPTDEAAESSPTRETRAPNSHTLPDGLTLQERNQFNHLSMGSQFIPLNWLRVLKSRKTGRPFLEKIDRFGLIDDPNDPQGLPIGLTAAPSVGLDIKGLNVGFNCAACHTSQIRYQNQTILITGGQGLFDVVAFTGELFDSMAATAKEPRELLAFVNRLWKVHPPTSDKDKEFSRHVQALLAHLETANAETRAKIEQRVKVLVAEATKQGNSAAHDHHLRDLLNGFNKTHHSILDLSQQFRWPIEKLSQTHAGEAVHRFSQDLFISARFLNGQAAMARQLIALKGRSLEQTAGGPGRVDDFDAGRNLLFPPDQAVGMTSPCSIPPLWGLKPGEWTDWDGNTTSALGRSMLTALAGGAVFDPKTHISSVRPQNLLELEQLSQKLKAPQWPQSILGALDQDRMARGKVLFAQHCGRCHKSLPRQDSEASQMDSVVSLAELGTDPTRIQNFAKPVSGKPLSAALQEVSKAYLEKAREMAPPSNPEAFEAMETTHPNHWRETNGYVARSLAGIWATPPYLHNGSVPTLADLLEPVDRRPASFWIGNADFDPEMVGYRSHKGIGFQFDTTQPGNSNSGHQFGTELSQEQKRDVLEFLKSL